MVYENNGTKKSIHGETVRVRKNPPVKKGGGSEEKEKLEEGGRIGDAECKTSFTVSIPPVS